MSTMNVEYYFACPIYMVEKPEFLKQVSEVSEEHLALARRDQTLDEIYPVYMTSNYSEDPRIAEFAKFITDASASILDTQGYNMSPFDMRFESMWTQEHHKHSAMEQHVHGGGVLIVGFYFIDVPDDSTRVVLHDPRAGKISIDLPQKDALSATIASQAINFTPKPGMMILTNAWLAHSFTRHRHEKPVTFVHFNLFPVFSSRSANASEAVIV